MGFSRSCCGLSLPLPRPNQPPRQPHPKMPLPILPGPAQPIPSGHGFGIRELAWKYSGLSVSMGNLFQGLPQIQNFTNNYILGKMAQCCSYLPGGCSQPLEVGSSPLDSPEHLRSQPKITSTNLKRLAIVGGWSSRVRLPQANHRFSNLQMSSPQIKRVHCISTKELSKGDVRGLN